jgi:hypothetical protein
MTWTTNTPNSRVFVAWVDQMMQRGSTEYTGLDSDTVNVALFNNTTTPDATVAVASTGFNTGVWVTGNEVTDATNWVSGGRALASKTFTFPGATNIYMFDAADLAGGGNVTLTNAFGCLAYDNTIATGTVAKQGVSYHYFGGAQSVTAGTFTIVWNANGLSRYTVT